MLRDGALYCLTLERYFLVVPLNGSRSRHSLRAHGYDFLVWVRFLASARGKSVWQADADDVGAYHRARRRSDAEFRISASTWNRAIASLDKLYRWAEREGLIERTPFTHRQVWRSEEHTSELQSLMRISYAVFCLQKKRRQLILARVSSHT